MTGMNENRITAIVGGASGDKVRRSRVVFMSDEYRVLEMSSPTNSLAPLGIAQEWCRNPPGTPFDTSLYAGVFGEEIEVYGNGATDVPAECGGVVTAGNILTVDSTARVVNAALPAFASFPLSFGLWTIGEAKESGTAGDVIRMRVRIGH